MITSVDGLKYPYDVSLAAAGSSVKERVIASGPLSAALQVFSRLELGWPEHIEITAARGNDVDVSIAVNGVHHELIVRSSSAESRRS